MKHSVLVRVAAIALLSLASGIVAWQNPGVYRDGHLSGWYAMNLYPGTQVLTPGAYYRTRKLAWSAAAEFTRERLEQVRQLRSEVVRNSQRIDALHRELGYAIKEGLAALARVAASNSRRA